MSSSHPHSHVHALQMLVTVWRGTLGPAFAHAPQALNLCRGFHLPGFGFFPLAVSPSSRSTVWAPASEPQPSLALVCLGPWPHTSLGLFVKFDALQKCTSFIAPRHQFLYCSSEGTCMCDSTLCESICSPGKKSANFSGAVLQ